LDAWELKLGLIVPSWNTVMEYEVQRLAGTGMSVHAQRIEHTGDTEEKLLALSTKAPAAAALLAHAKVGVIGYGCTAGGFLKGQRDDRAMAAAIAHETGIPCVSSASVIADALRAVGAKRISVASAYKPWLNDRVKQDLEAAGFEVLAIQGFGTEAHSEVTPARVAALAQEVDRPETEAIFISCSNLRTLESIEPVEAATGKPVVASNQSLMWGMLRALGDKRAIAGAGRLFRDA
jgi:arylmalonate decarboxylase